jgi:hypothetical protein
MLTDAGQLFDLFSFFSTRDACVRGSSLCTVRHAVIQGYLDTSPAVWSLPGELACHYLYAANTSEDMCCMLFSLYPLQAWVCGVVC